MKIKLLVAASLIIFSACQRTPVLDVEINNTSIPWKDTSSVHPRNTALLNLLDKYVQKGIPGISLLVNDSRGTWAGSAGKLDVDKNIRFMPGTVSQVASITKLFMGALTFRLMEDSANSNIGFRALNEQISKWLPERIISKISNGNLLTLAQCMKHETGVPDLIDEDAFYLAVLSNPNRNWSAEELLEYVYNKPAEFTPGAFAKYSNTNTLLLSLVLEYATGKKHHELLRKYVLQPLKLNNTFYQPYDKLPSNTSQGYFDLYNNNTLVNVTSVMTGGGNGYTGIYSNLFDLNTFIDALFIKKTFLKPSSLSLMQTVGKEDNNAQYGYGVIKAFLNLGVDAAYGHTGRELGYSGNLFYFPNKRVTHVFLVNYGTNAESVLKNVFTEFENELINITLQ